MNWVNIGSGNGLSPVQRWLIVNWTLWDRLQINLNRNSYIFIQDNAIKNICQICGHLVQGIWVNKLSINHQSMNGMLIYILDDTSPKADFSVHEFTTNTLIVIDYYNNHNCNVALYLTECTAVVYIPGLEWSGRVAQATNLYRWNGFHVSVRGICTFVGSVCWSGPRRWNASSSWLGIRLPFLFI